MRPREARRKVMIQARMRAGASWSDACILNLSSRGMLIKADQAPSRGSYLEIRRGAYVLVARVVWASSDRFGVQTQDPVPTEGLIHHPDHAGAGIAPHVGAFVERRAATRPAAVQFEASRQQSRAIEFCAFLLVGAVGAMLAQGAVEGIMAKPLAVVEKALNKS